LHMNIHSIYTQFTHTNTQHARTRTRICSRQRLRLSDEGRVKKRVKKRKHLKKSGNPPAAAYTSISPTTSLW
jgi:hypothetical protein